MPHCPEKVAPDHFTASFDAQTGIAQLKTHVQALLWTYSGYHLHPDSVVRQIANDPSVGVIQREVNQGMQFMTMLSSRLSRGR